MMSLVPSTACFLAAAVLLFFCWRGYLRSVRANLPSWRNGICLSALILLPFLWIFSAAVLAFDSSHLPRYWIDNGMSFLLFSFHLLVLVFAGLGLFLRGMPRLQYFLAAILMLFSWPIGYR
jgi:hypothetical protein